MTPHLNAYWMATPQFGFRRLISRKKPYPWWARYECCIRNRHVGYGLTRRAARRRAERAAA